MYKLLEYSWLILLYIIPSHSWSAACCGSSFAVPSVITSEDKAQISYSYVWSKIHADVNTNEEWTRRSDKDLTQTHKIEAAHVFSEHWQSGLSLPFIERKNSSHIKNKSSGPGDAIFQIGYEYLPDWDYNPIRPKGIGYLMAVIPTGKSIYESETSSGIDARGKGFWGLGIGTILVKTWEDWDASCNIEVHHYFSRTIKNSNTDGRVHPGAGISGSLGGGKSWNDLRIGGLIHWLYEKATTVSGTTNSEGALKRNATGTFLISYAMNLNQSLIVNYSDQTIFGDPYNTSLSKSFGIFFQWRFER
jgi:hypothetical protein